MIDRIQTLMRGHDAVADKLYSFDASAVAEKYFRGTLVTSVLQNQEKQNVTRRCVLWSIVGLSCIAIAGCAGTSTSKFSYTESYRPLQPVKDESCYDAAVLLEKSLEEAKDIVRKTLVAYDGGIEEERGNYIRARRIYRDGFFISSGGETIVVEFAAVDPRKTFVTVLTKTAALGRAGMKPWSCQIVDQLVRFATN